MDEDRYLEDMAERHPAVLSAEDSFDYDPVGAIDWYIETADDDELRDLVRLLCGDFSVAGIGPRALVKLLWRAVADNPRECDDLKTWWQEVMSDLGITYEEMGGET